MRRTTLMVSRIVSLCLAFVLGFFSAFGAIAGGIYFAYSSVSIEKLNKWAGFFGIEIPVDDFVNQEAETPITSLSLQDFLAEIQKIQNSELTLNEMITKYGLILPEDFVAKMPASILDNVAFADLFSEEGMDYVMKNVTVNDIFAMIPPEFSGVIGTEPMRETLKDHTLEDIVELNFGYIFEGVQLGYLMGVTYELDDNGVYQVVYATPDEPTIIELIAPLDLGGILGAVANGEGDVMEVIESSIGDVTVNALLGTFLADVAMLSNLLGDATLGDLIVLNPENNKYELDIMYVMNGKKLGSILGYTEVVSTDPETNETISVWYNADNNKVVGIESVLADISVSDFMNGQFSANDLMNDLVIGDILGYEKGKPLPTYKSDDLTTQLLIPEEEAVVVWYCGGDLADKVMSAFADKTFTWITTSFSELKLSAVLGYYQYDGSWYTWNIQEVNGESAIVLTEASGIMTKIADVQINQLNSIEGELKDIQIGELLGYKPVYGDDDEFLYWTTTDADGQTVEATGVTASLADLTVNEISNGKFQEKIDDLRIADVMGYTSDGEKWYKNGEEITGLMAALADSKIGSLSSVMDTLTMSEVLSLYKDENGVWCNKDGSPASSIMAALAETKVSEISKTIDTLTMAQVLGLKKNDKDVWCNSDGTEASSLMAALAETKVNEISTQMDTLTMAQVLGLEKDEKNVWHNSDGTKASSLMAALAETKVSEISSRMDTLTMAEIMGLEPGDNEGEWKNSDGTDASGIMAALATSTISSINKDINAIQIGKIAGYNKPTENNPEGKWYTKDGKEASGILAELSDLTVEDLGKESAVSDKIGNVVLADALGYKKVDGKWYDNKNQEVTGIMAALAEKPINDMNSAVDDLTLDQVLPGEKTGLLAIIPADTKISEINGAINNSIMTTPLQFFIDENLIVFDETSMTILDGKTAMNNDYVQPVGNHNYPTNSQGLVPQWRTKKLSESFGYMVKLLTM